MAARANQFEQFLMLFNAVEHAAKGEPQRIRTFWDQSELIRRAVEDLESFLRRTDFKRRVFLGKRKFWPQVPEDFERTWRMYEQTWSPAINDAQYAWLNEELDGFAAEMAEQGTPLQKGSRNEDRLPAPDPECELEFDPTYHDGAAAIDLGLIVIENELEFHKSDVGDETIENMCRIGLSAYEYLTETIGLDTDGVFRRWRSVPTTFVPTHVSNKHGVTEKGSLYDLLDDAVKAFVFGAPAACVAMCRAALEMILKQHYCPGPHASGDGLAKIIILAGERYKFIDPSQLKQLNHNANKILHDYGSVGNLSVEDERTIQQFLRTLKFLI